MAAAEEAQPQLNDEQQRVVDLVMQGRNVFFTGSAGTGKSFLLHQLISRLPVEGTVVTGTTGMAAVQIGGTTVHSFAGVGLADDAADKLVAKVVYNPGPREKWQRCHRLIIDEISMLDADLFEVLDRIGREIRGKDPQKPFGGIQLICTGDFLQLPPVGKRGQKKVRFCFQSPAWDTTFPPPDCVVELRQVFRQTDERFVNLLSQIRMGECRPDAQALLQTRVSRTWDKPERSTSSQPAIQRTLLYPRRKDVASENSKKLSLLSGPSVLYRASDTFYDQKQTRSTENLLRHMQAPETLELRVGAQVLLLKNLSPSEGLVNGTRGVVVGFEVLKSPPEGSFGSGSANVWKWESVNSAFYFPVVEFQVGLSREKAAGSTLRRILVPESWDVRSNGVNVASRLQVPLSLAWSITIHKCQGMTLEPVAMNISQCFSAGQAYVALSRARSLEGLFLAPFNAQTAISAEPAALHFYRKLRGTAGDDFAAPAPLFRSLPGYSLQELAAGEPAAAAASSASWSAQPPAASASSHSSSAASASSSGSYLREHWSNSSLPERAKHQLQQQSPPPPPPQLHEEKQEQDFKEDPADMVDDNEEELPQPPEAPAPPLVRPRRRRRQPVSDQDRDAAAAEDGSGKENSRPAKRQKLSAEPAAAAAIGSPEIDLDFTVDEERSQTTEVDGGGDREDQPAPPSFSQLLSTPAAASASNGTHAATVQNPPLDLDLDLDLDLPAAAASQNINHDDDFDVIADDNVDVHAGVNVDDDFDIIVDANVDQAAADAPAEVPAELLANSLSADLLDDIVEFESQQQQSQPPQQQQQQPPPPQSPGLEDLLQASPPRASSSPPAPAPVPAATALASSPSSSLSSLAAPFEPRAAKAAFVQIQAAVVAARRSQLEQQKQEEASSASSLVSLSYQPPPLMPAASSFASRRPPLSPAAPVSHSVAPAYQPPPQPPAPIAAAVPFLPQQPRPVQAAMPVDISYQLPPQQPHSQPQQQLPQPSTSSLPHLEAFPESCKVLVMVCRRHGLRCRPAHPSSPGSRGVLHSCAQGCALLLSLEDFSLD